MPSAVMAVAPRPPAKMASAARAEITTAAAVRRARACDKREPRPRSRTRLMDLLRIGSLLRAKRLEARLRQIDVARRASVGQATVARLEAGRCPAVRLDALTAIAAAVGVDAELVLRCGRARLALLLDARHARLGELVVTTFKANAWQVRVEYSFSHYGERGSVDVVGWRPAERALVVVEVKSQLVDVQDTLSTLDRKARLVPALLARDEGWRPALVGRILVLPEATASRLAIARHGATFDAALPDRTVAVRRWLALPRGELRGVWFLRNSSPANDMCRSTAVRGCDSPPGSERDAVTPPAALRRRGRQGGPPGTLVASTPDRVA